MNNLQAIQMLKKDARGEMCYSRGVPCLGRKKYFATNVHCFLLRVLNMSSVLALL